MREIRDPIVLGVVAIGLDAPLVHPRVRPLLIPLRYYVKVLIREVDEGLFGADLFFEVVLRLGVYSVRFFLHLCLEAVEGLAALQDGGAFFNQIRLL